MKTVKLFIISLLMLPVVCGCRGSEPFDNIVRAETTHAFNYVTSTSQRGGAAIYDDVRYYIVFDDDKRTANLTISNLRFPGEDTPLTLTFSDETMTYTSNNHEKQRIIKADALTSTDPVTDGTVITDVTIIYTESNALDPNGTEGIYARYTVDGRFVVTAYPYYIFADGTTVIDNLSEGGQMIDYDVTYRLSLNPDDMTAKMKICGLKFGNACADIVLSPLRLDLSDNTYVLSFTSATQCSSDVGIDVSSFSSSANLLDELKIDFDVLADDKSYHVGAFLTPDLSKG